MGIVIMMVAMASATVCVRGVVGNVVLRESVRFHQWISAIDHP
jgi:hypothetical protein